MNTQALTVNFHGQDLFIVEHNGQPYTPMKTIVTNMGLDWASQFTKLNANPKRWGIVLITIPTLGDMQQAVCMPLRKLLGWLSTISPSRVKPELREKIIFYQNECDDVLWEHWTKNQPKRNGLVELPEPPTITKTQIGEIACRVDEIVAASKDGGKVKPAIWSRFKNHFRINGYKELKADRYEEALDYLEKLREEYANGKRMVLVAVEEFEKLKQFTRADELLASPKLYTISEIVGVFNEIAKHDLAIVPKQKILALKKALENVF